MTNASINRMRIPCWVIIASLVAGGCTDDGLLTDTERAMLEEMVLDENTPIPASRTNRFADDPKAAELGHSLFFDMRLITGAGNCRTCHDTTNGGADTKSLGPTTLFGTAALSRNTPSIFNTAFLPGINHWGGNFTAVWSVSTDVGTSALAQAHYMYSDPYYRQTYESVFGPMPDLSDLVRFPAAGNYRTPAWQGMTPDDQRAMGRMMTNIGKSFEAYQRKLIDRSAPFDRFMNGDEAALSASAIRGAKLFVGRAACNDCHNGPSFSDFRFHNIGVPQEAGVPKIDYGFIAASAFQSGYPFNANSEFSDDPEYGAALVADMQKLTTAELPAACSGDNPLPGCGAFKTARLRSIGLTAPYMHTGGFTNLWDVVKFYSDGAGTDGFVGKRDIGIQPLFLSDADITDVVAFLESLTGEPIPSEWAKCPTTIPATACTAP
jgi:cytochrome c peroxidase